MDLSELRVQVKRLIHKRDTTADDDTGSPKNAEINQYINDARRYILNIVGSAYPVRFGQVSTTTYTALAESVALPSAAALTPIQYVSAKFVGDTIPFSLNAITPEETGQISLEGNPQWYFILGSDIYLRPRPTVALTLSIYHLKAVTDLSANSDTPSEIPATWHNLIAYRAAMEIRRVNDDPDGGITKAYNEKEEEFIRYMERIAPDSAVRQVADPAGWFQGWW